ncbi:MAG TPA: DUF5946 family protein [Pirellulales bacterium]|jgi:hypothetical protein|nr:DUF5946 family protein [Pirellulales bacterium]
MPRDWNHIPEPTPGASACPDCGARIDGGLGSCRAMFYATNRGRFRPADMRLGRLLVDSYALQHLEPYCRSAKELTYHLASLCCGLEHDGNSAIYSALQRSIDGKFTAERPTPPQHLGDLTILHLSEAATEAEYVERTKAWARSVWDAYFDLHSLARDWVRRSMGW